MVISPTLRWALISLPTSPAPGSVMQIYNIVLASVYALDNIVVKGNETAAEIKGTRPGSGNVSWQRQRRQCNQPAAVLSWVTPRYGDQLSFVMLPTPWPHLTILPVPGITLLIDLAIALPQDLSLHQGPSYPAVKSFFFYQVIPYIGR